MCMLNGTASIPRQEALIHSHVHQDCSGLVGIGASVPDLHGMVAVVDPLFCETGLYCLVGRIATPPEQTLCFTEKIAFLPNTYMVNDHRQSQQHQISGAFTVRDAETHGLPHHDTDVVLANFNHLQKLGPATFQLWTRILGAATDAKLWLLRFPREAEAHIKRQASAHGIDPQRVQFTDKFADVEHLRVKRSASLLLDTLEYNAHVSGLDALWAGLPLLTLAGENMARRCGASFLRTLGVPELLARTHDEYVEVGIALSTNPSILTHLRARMESLRFRSSLFDTQRWVRELERMLFLMWEVEVVKMQRSDDEGRMHIAMSGYNGWSIGDA
mmetsp:Transcript_27426/g.69211  ORF Transcript_27426/g.69211 Transcript_27426/m.69211 type:complete len:330 (-) Transcript_27426:166-1155(-)